MNKSPVKLRPDLTWPPAWQRLAFAAGGTRELGERLGVGVRGVRRWALEGVRPSGPALALLILTCKQLGVTSPIAEHDSADRTLDLFAESSNAGRALVLRDYKTKATVSIQSAKKKRAKARRKKAA